MKISTLHVALIVSLGLHAGLLMLRIVNPEAFKRMFEDAPLEVILVNASSTQPPTEAKAVAQSNLAGGGDVDKGRATSPLPPSAVIAQGDAEEDRRMQMEQLQEEQQQLLAQLRNQVSTLPPPDPQRDKGTPQDTAQEEKRRQLVQLLAEIEKRINEENTRPRRRYVSPATREEIYALYYDALRRKIEERGTRNFPELGGQKLYGELTISLVIDAFGQVVGAEVVKSSGSSQLDRRALAIARAAAPFGPFTEAMRKHFDQLVVTSRFKFTREDGLSTTVAAPSSP